MESLQKYQAEVAASLRRQGVDPQRLPRKVWRYAVLACKTGLLFKQPEFKTASLIVFFGQRMQNCYKDVA